VERLVGRRWPCDQGYILVHGTPLSVWDAALIALKTSTYAATFGAAGAAFFLGYSGSLVTNPDRVKIRRIALGLSMLSVVTGGAQILVTAGSMSSAAAGMWDGTMVHMVWQAGAGRAYEVRGLGLLLVALAVLRNLPAWPACIGAAIAATSFAWTGHARSLHPNALPVLLLCVHLLGAAFWLGALGPLAVVARNRELPRIAAMASRFGIAALFVVAGLMAAGLGLLCMMLGSVSQMWATEYGRFVMLKLSFVAGLLCLAASNKLRLTPRLLAGDARALCGLRISLRLESLLGALILTVTATFTTITGAPALG
jgi:putative copper resistance protein D